VRFGTLPLCASLYPCKTAIHKQFRYRDVALLLLAMLSHAGPIRVDLDVGPGMLGVLLGREITLAQGLLPRGAHVILAAFAKLGDARTESASPRAIAAIRLFPIVMVSLLDSKSLPIHKLP
jgi:hypothetical protein